jgi:hypothetical protein
LLFIWGLKNEHNQLEICGSGSKLHRNPAAQAKAGKHLSFKCRRYFDLGWKVGAKEEPAGNV